MNCSDFFEQDNNKPEIIITIQRGIDLIIDKLKGKKLKNGSSKLVKFNLREIKLL
jgi:hypothetical protein